MTASAGRLRHRVGPAAVAVIVVLAAGACQSASAKPTLTLGAVYPTTGSQSRGGIPELRGVQLAVELANQEGGVKGRQVRLAVHDVETADQAPDAVSALKARGVQVVIGSHGSSVSAATAVATARRGMLLWETGAVGQTPGEGDPGKNFFRAAPTGSTLGRAAIDFVGDELLGRMAIPPRPLNYGVAYVDDPYGRAVGLGAVDEINRRGLHMAGQFAYDARSTDWNELARRIAASGTDVLFVSAYVDDGVALRQAMVTEHVPLVASIGTSSSYCHPEFGDRLGPAAVGLFASDKPDAHDVNPASLLPDGRRTLAWASQRYEERFHEPMDAPALAGFANGYGLLHYVLPAAASLSIDAVRAAVLAVKAPQGTLANGSGIDFAPAGQIDAGSNRAAVSVIWEWVAERTRKVVWPPAYAEQAIKAIPISS